MKFQHENDMNVHSRQGRQRHSLRLSSHFTLLPQSGRASSGITAERDNRKFCWWLHKREGEATRAICWCSLLRSRLAVLKDQCVQKTTCEKVCACVCVCLVSWRSRESHVLWWGRVGWGWGGTQRENLLKKWSDGRRCDYRQMNCRRSERSIGVNKGRAARW